MGAANKRCSFLVIGHAKFGQGEEALKILQQMQQVGVFRNAIKLPSSVKACNNIIVKRKAFEVQSKIMKRGFDRDSFGIHSVRYIKNYGYSVEGGINRFALCQCGKFTRLSGYVVASKVVRERERERERELESHTVVEES